jgi:hypothetical protein
MKKTLMIAAAALTLSVAALAPSDAQACGSYGPPPAEQVARSDVYAALDEHGVTRYVVDVGVALFDGRRGEASISYNNGRTLMVGLLHHRGQWVVTRHVPRRSSATRAVAAR